TNCRKS
ncbi:Ditrans,polycis-undecaprenyl-diphosphate synthase ((2E,6E)-farnesyl-diphosphate specific), partial [Haemophilus influenzae]